MSVASDIYISPEDESPVSSNPFAAPKMPYDVLMYVLNEFLTPADRFNFNQVLEPQERVYKRFPKDYSISHQICISRCRWNSVADIFNLHKEKAISQNYRKKHSTKAILYMILLFHFFKEPNNQVLLRFVEGRKQDFMSNMKTFTKPDKFYEMSTMTPTKKEYLMKQAQITHDLIASIPFERDIDV